MIYWTVSPPAIMLTTVATGIRRPRRQGTPPITFGSTVILFMLHRYFIVEASPR